MNKKRLSVLQRYILIIILTFLLIILGAIFLKSCNMTPETHFEKAVALLHKNKPEKALFHFIQASKSHHHSIQVLSAYNLAHIYQKGGDGLPVNMEKAVFYYEQAASLEMPAAQYELAILYDNGVKIPENRDKAVNLMMKAAKNLPEAKYALAVWIERGYLGEPNQAWAVSLYEQAANAGIQNAVKSLISIYHGGYGRFPENIRREQYWRRRLGNQK